MSTVNSEIKLTFASNEPLHLETAPLMRSFPFTYTQRSTWHTVHTHAPSNADSLHEIRLTPTPPSVCMQMKQSAHQTGKLRLFTVWLWNCWRSDICQAFGIVRGNKAKRRGSKCLSLRSGWNVCLSGAVCQQLQYQCQRETCMIRIMVERQRKYEQICDLTQFIPLHINLYRHLKFFSNAGGHTSHFSHHVRSVHHVWTKCRLHRLNTCKSSDLFKEKTLVLTLQAAGEEGGTCGAVSERQDATFSAGRSCLLSYSFDRRLQSVSPELTAATKTLATTRHHNLDTARVAGHPQDILNCRCTGLPAALGKQRWKCRLAHI